MLTFGGQASRSSDLFGNMTSTSIAKRLMKGLKGVENIYTQHTPYLKTILEDLIKGRLKDTVYSYMGLVHTPTDLRRDARTVSGCIHAD